MANMVDMVKVLCFALTEGKVSFKYQTPTKLISY